MTLDYLNKQEIHAIKETLVWVSWSNVTEQMRKQVIDECEARLRSFTELERDIIWVDYMVESLFSGWNVESRDQFPINYWYRIHRTRLNSKLYEVPN